MKLTNKNILLISPEPWDHISVSKHHYSVYLAKRGNRVFFLNPPSSTRSVENTVFKNVFSVHYRGFVKGLQFLPALLRHRFVRSGYNALQMLCGVRFDLVWSFDNSVFYDFDALPSEVFKISHIVDLNQDFHTGKAASTADYCFCTTDLIMARLLRFNSRVAKVNHGFHPGNSDKLVTGSRTAATALYSGNLGMPFIDWVVLEKIVTNHPDVEFVFLGPGEMNVSRDPAIAGAKSRVRQKKNARFIGAVGSDTLQQYYRSADILLIAYQERFHKDQANPHKMMEYLGSGQAVVATYTAEYGALSAQGLIAMTKRNADFPSAFADTIGNLAHWNSKTFQQARIGFAMANTYEKQIEKIEHIIDHG